MDRGEPTKTKKHLATRSKDLMDWRAWKVWRKLAMRGKEKSGIYDRKYAQFPKPRRGWEKGEKETSTGTSKNWGRTKTSWKEEEELGYSGNEKDREEEIWLRSDWEEKVG